VVLCKHMNTKDILENVNQRIVFADQVLQGIGNVFQDFAESNFGEKIIVERPLSAKIVAHGAAGLTKVDAQSGTMTEVDATLFADGRVKVSVHQSLGSEDGGRCEIGSYELLFHPETDHPENVAARTIAATMSLPDDVICQRLSEYVQAMTNGRLRFLEVSKTHSSREPV